ncbi:hypothetical protein BPTFM16_00207 [Altererythrobacter insulae]|nr:hypothetical protein BPTFM16_00207 [Altererythrobacter insulae]
MIIVVEGISAAGKTTYASQFGGQHCLPEIPVKQARPESGAPLEVHAEFWAEHNARRFEMAVEIERQNGFVVCDTDPLKLHYAWCMERAGFEWPDKFDVARKCVRQKIAERRLGFADLYLIKLIEPDIARAQKEGDKTRSRSNFEQHLHLQPHLVSWFEALSGALPHRVHWSFQAPDQLLSQAKTKTPEENPRRFDVSVFDELLDRLPS